MGVTALAAALGVTGTVYASATDPTKTKKTYSWDELDRIFSTNETGGELDPNMPGVVRAFYNNQYAANTPLEDTHLEQAFTAKNGLVRFVFGVFDGHSGTGASMFCSQDDMGGYIRGRLDDVDVAIEELAKRSGNGEARLAGMLPRIRSPELRRALNARAMREAFQDADAAFLCRGAILGDVRTCLMGACAITAMVEGTTLYVANAGDCRAVVGRATTEGSARFYKPIPLSVDHQADNPIEEARIRASHPKDPEAVKRGRVKGRLQPSRAVGDAIYKHPYFPPFATHKKLPADWDPPYITATPDVTVHELTDEDEFLVIACDGLWEKLSNDEVVKFVSEFPEIKKKEKLAENVSTFLIKQALAKGRNGDFKQRLEDVVNIPPEQRRRQHDDMTVTVVYFNRQRGVKPDGTEYLVYKAQDNVGVNVNADPAVPVSMTVKGANFTEPQLPRALNFLVNAKLSKVGKGPMRSVSVHGKIIQDVNLGQFLYDYWPRVLEKGNTAQWVLATLFEMNRAATPQTADARMDSLIAATSRG